MSPKIKIIAIHTADENNQVVTLKATGDDGAFSYMRKPCPDCPWRKDSPPGAFPAEAFRHSAITTYDMSTTKFACHQSGTNKPSACAGFLLKGAEHNLSVRLATIKGEFDPSTVTANGLELYEGYRTMAIANGVDPDDLAIAQCRGDDEHELSPATQHLPL